MNKIAFAGIIIFLLLGAFYFQWGGTVITKDNALKECPILNVKCDKVLETKEPEIRYVGENVKSFCNNNEWGCYYPSINVIYMGSEDWMVLAHEQCHRFCGNEHVYNQKEFYIINP